MECLDEDSVLSFVDGSLDDETHDAVAAHIASCLSCSDLIAAAAGGDMMRLAGSTTSEDAGSTSSGLARGATVGRYVILDLVGRGGMGVVYAAYDPQLDRKIALKLLHETTSGDATAHTARDRLLREAKAIARLSHPNVVVVHDAGAIEEPGHGDRVFLAMEFIEGETLSEWLASAPRSWRSIRDVYAAAGEGLAAAHEAGLVHRDFKPQNVMVGRDGSVRVMDFGLASEPLELDDAAAVAPTPQTVALTRTGVLLGTPLYMAPEQFLARATDARTDQFSFCVALHEALYGERPFPSESFPALLDAVIAGRIREPAQKARVPAFLRKLLLRGLAADPALRYPSMRSLLDMLRDDPLRRRRTVAIVAAAAVVVLAAAVGTQRFVTRGQRMCVGAADKLAGVWEQADGGERRSAVHRSFLGTGRPFAEETWIRVSALLDDYSRRWTSVYTDACEATHVRGDQSGEVLDLRMSCLEGPRGALRALTDVLSRTDTAVLIEAVNATRALPALERCSDVPALRAVVPPPTDAATRTRVAALESRLAEVKALADTGQWPAGLGMTGPLVAAARTTGYEPLLAEMLATRAWLQYFSGEMEAGTKTFEEAVWMAMAARRDDIAVESASWLMGIAAYVLGHQEDSERWEKLAEALQRRLGPGHERTAAWLYQDRAVARQARGDYRSALADLDLALSLKRKILAPNHPDIARTLWTIANVDNELGEHGAALVAAERAMAIYRDAYGGSSPQLAQPLGIRGESFELLGRHEEAERDLRAAVELSTSWVGAEHPWTAIHLTALGKTLVAEHRSREATAILERALRIREHAEPNAEPNKELLAETRFALARARWEIDPDHDRAISLAEAARDDYGKLPRQTEHSAEIDAWLRDKTGKQPRD